MYYTAPKCWKLSLSLWADFSFVKEKVVGFHYLGPNAGEVTQGYGGMIKLGAKKADFDNLIGIHPTTAEVSWNMLPDFQPYTFRLSPQWGSPRLAGRTLVHRAAEVKVAALCQKWRKAALAPWNPYLELLAPTHEESFDIPSWNGWIWCKGRKGAACSHQDFHDSVEILGRVWCPNWTMIMSKLLCHNDKREHDTYLWPCNFLNM